ncbi:MAG: diphthine--ammonia ligase [Bacillati bacterium ANGP1]|uniref:Diphthine--ammonia ligase n=1 Tax=Candidatus Segetimicrobium genomatis TaxID=2569760 RepID=A0A537JY88_9BACT|nr:MAG: diphthine--ammonia ligase [Terrabacteria group bacterium ANGP1]
MLKPKAVVSWSGGKDSYMALHRALARFDVQALLTMFTEDGARSRSHGLRPEVVAQQAHLLDLRLVSGRGSWKNYEQEFKRVLRRLAGSGFSHVIFGDIFLDAHKAWVERVCRECRLEAVEPLWGEPTGSLFRQFIATGAEAQIVATKAMLLDQHWLGRRLDAAMLSRLERLGVDPCGERGEYHTLVVGCPRMSARLELREIDRLMHEGYWMLDLEVA